MINGFEVGDYLRLRGEYGVIDRIFCDANGEITVEVSWYIIDRTKSRVKETITRYHRRELLFYAEKVVKSAVMVELI